MPFFSVFLISPYLMNHNNTREYNFPDAPVASLHFRNDTRMMIPMITSAAKLMSRGRITP
jgi:hypothetical protein